MKAPEFSQDLRWFNGGPQSMKELRGKVVLVDFWTYSCVNCIRTLPYLKRWYHTYGPKGLVVIGVHTPEFEFEKDGGNVSRAIKRFEIEYPVAMDNDYQIWSLYGNRYWPHKYLVNKDGGMVYDHAGEGSYAETEAAIQAALREIDPDVELPPLENAEDGSGGVCLPGTPETYLGSLRGRSGKIWHTEGPWRIHPEFVEHERATDGFVDRITLEFDAAEVNIVAEAPGERPAKLQVSLNGGDPKEVEIHEARLYNVFSDTKMTKGILAIAVKDDRVRFYAFTFGGCKGE